MMEVQSDVDNFKMAPGSTSKPGSLTCISCRMLFNNVKDQREHYKSDFHRFNLKRKVTNLPPISLETFEEKVQSLLQQDKDEKGNTSSNSFDCKPCGKSYSSQNAYQQHLKSNKHLEKSAQEPQDKTSSEELKTSKKGEKKSGNSSSSSSSSSSADLVDTSDFTFFERQNKNKNKEEEQKTQQRSKEEKLQQNQEKGKENQTLEENEEKEEEEGEGKGGEEQEEEEAIQQKLKNARYFSEIECIFCSHKGKDFDTNLEHMTHKHGLFLPDIEYLVDLRGLIKYLGEKVSVGNVCLYCNGKGKSFHSVEAVQAHMRTQNHCKILYEEEDNLGEYDDFYDFSKDYANLPSQSNNEGGEEDKDRIDHLVKSTVQVSEDGHHLQFQDGRQVGHRSLQVYYKQRFRPIDNRDAIVLNKLQSEYKQLGWTDEWEAKRKTFEPKSYSTRVYEGRKQLKVAVKKNNQKFPNQQTASC